MTTTQLSSEIPQRKVVVVYKHSRLSHAIERGSRKDKSRLQDSSDKITKDLLESHENNLRSIEAIKNILTDLRIDFDVICREDLTRSSLSNKFVISVGGDGTLLDASHYCFDSPILGVNSDPLTSIGALCIAHIANFREILSEIYVGTLKPSELMRLSIAIDNEPIEPLALNDILFCHKSPAALSRFALTTKNITESHRSSGIWISTPAGSTGGIYSCGANELPLDDKRAIFRMREPYWCDAAIPRFLEGSLSGKETLTIRSTMTDGQIFIDGPHKTIDISLGESVEVSLSDQPLFLFDGSRLNSNRKQIIEQRKSIRKFF